MASWERVTSFQSLIKLLSYNLEVEILNSSIFFFFFYNFSFLCVILALMLLLCNNGFICTDVF